MINSRPFTPRPLALGNKALPTPVQALAEKQIVTDLTQRPSLDSSITPIDPGKVINFLPIPPKITVTVLNGSVTAGTGFFLNNSDFTALPASWTATYSDGFSGKLMTRLMNGLGGATGLYIYGFNVTGYDSDGVKSDAVLNSSSIDAVYYTGNGTSYVPASINIAGAERNTQFKDGLLTVRVEMVLNFLTQIKCYLGAGESLQFVFFTQPIVG